MPLHKVTIYKRLNAGTDFRYWSNVYRVEADDINDALDKGVTIANIEQAVHKDYVAFSKVTARLDVTPAPPGGSRLLTGAGDVEGDPSVRLPRWNTVRCTFTDEIGRPDQKYLRLPLEEGDVTDGTLNVAIINAVSLGYVAPISELEFIRSSDNAPYTSGRVEEPIQMRQIGWHRRTRPGFHRGYVPD